MEVAPFTAFVSLSFFAQQKLHLILVWFHFEMVIICMTRVSTAWSTAQVGLEHRVAACLCLLSAAIKA